MQDVVVPAVGESVAGGILAAWLVEDGAYVTAGQEIFELETDKATMPVPAPVAGTLTITVGADEEVAIGAVVARIDPAGAAASSGGGEAPAAPTPAAPATPAPTAPPPAPQQPAADSGAAAAGSDAISPAVRRALAESGVSAKEVRASGAGSGKDGRLTKADVEAYERPAAAATTPAATPASSAASGGASGRQERKKMTMLRRTIAENLVRSKRDSAHLTTFNEVDMSAVTALRNRYKEAFEKRHGVRLGFMSFFVAAAQRALEEFPHVNAYVDGHDIIYNHFYNVGVAISTEAGLVVPVLRDVDSLSFADIEAQIVDFADRARRKRILPDEFQGGTFTITNGGVFGSMLSTPIPNPPQTAIMGMHSINKRPVVVDDQIVIRPMMYLALTYDHRIIDGREAIGFLNAVKRQIEDPASMLLGL